jgi:hypothetical protein
MSEQTGASAEGSQETNQDQAAQQGDPADKPLGPNGEKALAAERAARAAAEKAAAGYKAQLDQIEQANLSEIEKAQKQAADAQSELAAITRQNLVNSRALAKSLPADLVEFITASDEAEVDKQIDTLLARVKAPTTPKPDPNQGAAGDGKSSTAAQFAATIANL